MTTPFQITPYLADNYIEIRLECDVSVATLQQARQKAAEHPDFTSTIGFLWDVRQSVVGEISMSDSLVAANQGWKMIPSSIAIVWRTTFQFAVGRQLSNLLNFDPDRVLFTSNLEEARIWLKNQ